MADAAALRHVASRKFQAFSSRRLSTANRFVVDVSGLKLAKGADAKLAGTIQQAVLKAIAETHTEPQLVLKFPKDWLGLVAHIDQAQIAAVEKQVAGMMR
ncbi:hypothetical protein ACVDG8_034890 [Mesorhizobium sp. ORM8.1]